MEQINYKLLTKVTQQDLDEGVWDADHKGLYSRDGKRFLQYIRPKELEWGQLDSFTFKSGVEVICDKAFEDSSFFNKFDIPQTVVAIGDYAFMRLHLPFHSVITFPKGLKYVGRKVFGHFYERILSLVFEEGLKEVNLGELLDFAAATTIYLPSTLENIGEEGFGETNATIHINLADGNKHFSMENGVLYDYSKTTLVRCPITKRGKLRIPEGTKTIGAYAFRLCGWENAIDAEPEPKLSVILPQSLTMIKEGAFRHTWIDSLYIPENVSEIEEGAFENANHLIIEVSPNNQFFEIRNNLLIDKREMKVLFGMSNNVEIPNDVKSIANYAFRHLEPKSIVIPEGVTRIGLDNLNLNTLIHVSLPSTLQRITRFSFWGQIGFTEEPLVIEVPFGMGDKFKKKLYSDDGYYISSDIKEKQIVKVEQESWNDAKQKNLERFLHAQDSGGIYDGTGTYAEALQEVKNGHKSGHWIWYVFPQMKGLGRSEISQFYGINGREEAYEYMNHPILRSRYIESCQAILDSGKSVYEIFGADACKVRSSILLMNSVWNDDVIKEVIKQHGWK